MPGLEIEKLLVLELTVMEPGATCVPLGIETEVCTPAVLSNVTKSPLKNTSLANGVVRLFQLLVVLISQI